MSHPTLLKALFSLCTLLLSGYALAQNSTSCYQQLDLQEPKGNINKALYILVDQTLPLNATMRSNLNKLLSIHPQTGEMVRVARFSPNIKGQYTELLYEGVLDSKPSEAYLYHLRDDKNEALTNCLFEQKQNGQKNFQSAFKSSLGRIDTKLPRTEIFYSLKRLSETVLINDNITDKTVLIISDGLENSEVSNFYRRKSVTKINVAREMAKVNQHDLVADWRGAKLYMFGLGNISDQRKHIKPSQLDPLLRFWHSYFHAGGAIIKELGTPAILSRQL